MKSVARFIVLFSLSVAVGSLITSCATQKAPADNRLRAGLAEIDITPPVGYRMAGYYDERFSTGIHDPLKAKALVLQQGRQKIALVFCDLVGMSLPVSTNARAQASILYNIPVSCISIFATHSHTGPLFNDVRDTYFHEDAIARFGRDEHEKIDYPPFLIERLVKVIGEANARLEPSDLWSGVAQQEGIPYNRRSKMKNGKVVFNPGQLNPNVIGPAGPVDHDVGMLMVSHGQFDLLGGLTVFAMHGDTVSGTDFSADYPYYIQQTLRNELGDHYISMFGAGTCGDLNHINVNKKEQVKGQAVAKDLGAAIGRTVLNNVKKVKHIKTPSLASLNKVITVDLQETTPEKVAEAKKNLPKLASEEMNFYDKVEMVKALDLDHRGRTWPMEVQVYRIDAETAVVGLPAEIFVEFGLAIKKRSPFKKTLVIALNNDRPSYVPTLKAFDEGSYEVTNSRVKPGTGEKLVEVAVSLLKELQPTPGMEDDDNTLDKK